MNPWFSCFRLILTQKEMLQSPLCSMFEPFHFGRKKIQNFTGIADVHSLKIANCWLIRCWLAEFLGHLTEGHPPCKSLDVGAGQPEWRGIIEAAHPSDW